ncbi:MAG TPA: hypothetical protein VFX33_07680 [Actinomycetales bacterium]|nr:hypothetical protein [Actinomycetales bacterium]
MLPVHLGKPPRTVFGLVVKGIVATGRRFRLVAQDRWGSYPPPGPLRTSFPGFGWLLWHVATAHDRRHMYRRVSRHVAAGRLVVSDRFPIPELALMDGPRAQWLADVDIPALASLLVRYERHCYRAVPKPDLLIVLRLEPELAVRRKSGVDPAAFVRARSAEVYAREWPNGRAHVVDASRSRAEVAVAIRRAVWSSLV